MNYFTQGTNLQFEDRFSKNAKSVAFIRHEILLKMNFFHSEPPNKNKKIGFFDFHYTIVLGLPNEGEN